VEKQVVDVTRAAWTGDLHPLRVQVGWNKLKVSVRFGAARFEAG